MRWLGSGDFLAKRDCALDRSREPPTEIGDYDGGEPGEASGIPMINLLGIASFNFGSGILQPIFQRWVSQ